MKAAARASSAARSASHDGSCLRKRTRSFSIISALALVGVIAFSLFATIVAPFAQAAESTDSPKSKPSSGSGIAVGIDLGTTYSCVSVFKNGRAEVIANEQGNRVTPSYVAFTKHDTLVGEAAKNQLAENPRNTIYDAKRFIGRDVTDKVVLNDKKLYDFDLIVENNRWVFNVTHYGKEKHYTPEQISAFVLIKMKEIATAYLGFNVTRAVITVPAYFNDDQRTATKNAGTIAGLEVLRVINEPTAAALAYGLDKKSKKESNILVYDLGGGTFDVSLLSIDDGVFEVKATSGDTRLGGQDFDQIVMDWAIKSYVSKHKIKDFQIKPQSRGRLRAQVERAKRELSSATRATITVENFDETYGDLQLTLSRALFEELNLNRFKSTLIPVQKVLKDSKMAKTEVDEIVLVGGSTRIPRIQKLISESFNNREPSREINPDEAVAQGAAIQASILSGSDEVGDIVLIDVNPLTLGIQTTGGVMTKIIPRSTAIPTKKSQIFSTAADNQASVQIIVYEGERAFTKDNRQLGMFLLDGIPPAPRGVPQIEVSFEIDANGILTVTAQDKATSKKKSIILTPDSNSRLSKEEIERMVKESAEFEEIDRQAKNRIEARNHFEAYVYNLRTQFTGDLKSRTSEENVKTVLDAVEKAIEWIGANGDTASLDEIKEKNSEVETIVKPIITAIYGAAAEGGADGESEGAGSAEDSTRDEDEDEHDEL